MNNNLEVNIKYFDDTMPKLNKYDNGDWIDLRVRDVSMICGNGEWIEEKFYKYSKFSYLKIYLGVAMALPEGFEAHVLPRSSLFKNTSLILTNSMGIIDNSYCGKDDEWIFPAYSLEEGLIEKHQRIAQFRIERTMVTNFGGIIFYESELSDKSRGGFGSTNK